MQDAADCHFMVLAGTERPSLGDAQWKDKIVRIGFDGAMSEAKVWINGVKVGEHPYGYTGLR